MASIQAKNKAQIYVARDIERALGQKPEGNYFIITNNTSYARSIHSLYPQNIFLIDSEKILDTYELLSEKRVQEIISKYDSEIIVFKNTKQIEAICYTHGFKLLNPSALLAENIENKITQVEWLGPLVKYLPPHRIVPLKKVNWENKPFIVQWAHGHTGSGTVLISNESILEDLKKKFPEREARATDYIKGPMFTINIVVDKYKVLLGNISYQITGMLPFTLNLFSTIGNDWSLPHTILDENQIHHFHQIANEVGKKMQESGWRGLFGIDVIHDEERNTLHLIEINARQPASSTFESELQANLLNEGVLGYSTFEAHILALTDSLLPEDLIQINDGAQIIQRVTSATESVRSEKLTEVGYKTISYLNNEINADLLRIQSEKGIFETHNKFNKRGKEIIELLKPV